MLFSDLSPSSIAVVAVRHGLPSKALRTESLIKVVEWPSLMQLSTSHLQLLHGIYLSSPISPYQQLWCNGTSPCHMPQCHQTHHHCPRSHTPVQSLTVPPKCYGKLHEKLAALCLVCPIPRDVLASALNHPLQHTG